MADAIKRISVRIGGMNYQLVSMENDQYTRQIAAKADEMIRRMMQANPQLSLNMAAVLALVNSQDELSRIYQQFRASDSQREESDKQQADMRQELMRLREQVWEMKKELLRLGSLCRDYESLLARTPVLPEGIAQPDLPAQAGSYERSADEPHAAIVKEADPEASSGDETGQADRNHAFTLTQTNLDDYLRDNGWTQPVEEKKYDRHDY